MVHNFIDVVKLLSFEALRVKTPENYWRGGQEHNASVSSMSQVVMTHRSPSCTRRRFPTEFILEERLDAVGFAGGDQFIRGMQAFGCYQVFLGLFEGCEEEEMRKGIQATMLCRLFFVCIKVAVRPL